LDNLFDMIYEEGYKVALQVYWLWGAVRRSIGPYGWCLSLQVCQQASRSFVGNSTLRSALGEVVFRAIRAIIAWLRVGCLRRWSQAVC